MDPTKIEINVPTIDSSTQSMPDTIVAPPAAGTPAAPAGDALQDMLNQQQNDADKANEDLQRQFQAK